MKVICVVLRVLKRRRNGGKRCHIIAVGWGTIAYTLVGPVVKRSGIHYYNNINTRLIAQEKHNIILSIMITFNRGS